MPLTVENRGRRTVVSCHLARTTPGRLAPLMALVSLAAVLVGVTGYLGVERAGTVHVSATVITHEFDRFLAAEATDGSAEEGYSGQQKGREASPSERSSSRCHCCGVGDGRRAEEQTGVAPGDCDDSAMVQKYYLKRDGVRYRLPKPKTKADNCAKAKALLLPTAKVRPGDTLATGNSELVDDDDDDNDEGSFEEDPATSAPGSDDLAPSNEDDAPAPGLGSEITVEKVRQEKQADAADPPKRRSSCKVTGKLSCGRRLSQAELNESFETCRGWVRARLGRSASSSEGMLGANHGMSEAGNSLEPVDDSSFGHAVTDDHEEVGEEPKEEEAFEEFSDDPDGVD